MFNGHFYHAITRKAVAVFGTLFNNITVIKTDSSGNVKDITKVPLAYGPRQKFLSRIDEQADLTDPKVAIKLPRLSFEITNMQYDSTTTLSSMSKVSTVTNDTTRNQVFNPAPYIIDMQLNILAKNQDDALQILEQIIPMFKPSYTLSVKFVEGMPSVDVPITLQSVSLMDDYEGDYTTRRVLMYTLDFQMKVRYFAGLSESKIIKKVFTNFFNKNDGAFFETQIVEAANLTAKGLAIVSVSGEVEEIRVMDGGMKYTSPPTVTIAPPPGTGSTVPTYSPGAEVSINAAIGATAVLVDSTSGYAVGDIIAFKESTPYYTIDSIVGNTFNLTSALTEAVVTGQTVYAVDGIASTTRLQATAEAVLTDGVVTSFIVTEPGAGYNVIDVPAVTLSAPTGATMQDAIDAEPSVSIDFIPSYASYTIKVTDPVEPEYEIGEVVVGDQSGTQGLIVAKEWDQYTDYLTITLNNVDGYFLVGEKIIGLSSLQRHTVREYDVNW